MIKKDYSLNNIYSLGINYIYTKLISPSSRLIRYPIQIIGKKYIEWGSGLTTGKGCRFDVFKLEGHSAPRLSFGKNVQLNDYVHICTMNKVVIGDNTLIASHVYISDNSHGSYKGDEHDASPLTNPIERTYPTSRVQIGNRVWIGEGVMILPGVSIGDGAVIGAHSVVSKDIPANTIAIGSPARVIKKYNFVTEKWERIP